MILKKLQEALAEVDSQRRALDDVERQLRLMISTLSGGSSPVNETLPFAPSLVSTRTVNRDRIDDIVDILAAEGKPLHITKIAERLSGVLGKKIERTELEPGLNRHVQKTKKARIAKFAPSTYGLPSWKQATDIEILAAQAKVS